MRWGMPVSLTAWVHALPEGTLWNKDWLFIAAAVSAGYLLFSEKAPASAKMKFLLGIWLYCLCWGSPLYLLSHLMFSVHMFKMSVLYFFVPPLLLSGLPAGAAARLMKAAGAGPLSKPAAAAAAFNGLFLLYHVPAVMEQAMIRPLLHAFFHALLFASSVPMWLAAAVGAAGPGEAGKQYMRLNMRILMPACLLLVASLIRYEHFADPVRQMAVVGVCFPAAAGLAAESCAQLLPFPRMPSAFDHQLGGALMLAAHRLSFGLAHLLLKTRFKVMSNL